MCSFRPLRGNFSKYLCFDNLYSMQECARISLEEDVWILALHFAPTESIILCSCKTMHDCCKYVVAMELLHIMVMS
jgi:hypothetical protein